MKRITAFLSLLLLGVSMVMAERHDWENNHVLQINREPARAYFIPFAEKHGDRQLSLNGQWRFRWTPTPDGRVKDFYRTDFNDSSWKMFPVPANWEVNGYGTPIYASAGYTFKIDPPFVMKEPKENFTTYKERNPTGQYRRTFTLPSGWKDNGRQVYLRFEGVMSAYYVWINGKRVGYSQGSCEASEYNVTDVIDDGENIIALEVYKYSDGSYLEDQDFWRFGGIHRDITLYCTPDVRLRDFAVRTIAIDETYTNYRLQVNPKLQVAGNATGDGYTVRATLTDADGKEVCTMNADAEPILDLQHKAAVMNEWFPQRGRSKFERMQAEVSGVHPWTAETPYLYTLRLQLCNASGDVVEQLEQKVGFRHLAIDHGRFLVNGKQVRFRGVNRHEHDPYLAHVMTEEVMLKDLQLMKQANVNAIRLAHYPNTPRFYELCDSMGFYLMDEANSENHGVRGLLTSTPDWNDAMMDRAIRMAERDKNHPSVVFWSLGNESGFGANHAAMAGWLHEFDPTRFVHYEGAQGDNGAPDPQCVDIISRFYPRVQQEYLNPGIPEGSDQERAENARWEFLLSIGQRKTAFTDGIAIGKIDDRPVLTSEYAHCMGNALGNFKEYWDEFYSNPRMLGGFIWDWVDQGIILNSQSVRYGGDFGDKPNLKAFCLNGVVFSDRTTNSKFEEVKAIYSPVQFSLHGNDIYVINRSSHLPLTDYTASASVYANGVKITKAATNKKTGNTVWSLPDIAYGDSAVVAHVSDYPLNARADYRLNISVTQKSNNLNVLNAQLPLSGSVMDYAETCKNTKCKDVNIKDIIGNVEPLFYRAPTDNDTGFGNWLAKDWLKQRIDSPTVKRIETRETEGYYVDEYVFNNGTVNNEGKVVVTTKQTRLSDGSLDIVQTYECKGNIPELPRLGMLLRLPKDYEKLEYYGRGPWDNYPDRKQSSTVGLWRSTVTNEYVHYPKPQDSGNHEDCSTVVLSTKNGKKKVIVTAVDAPFSFSALHYLPTTISAVKHDYELKEDNLTALAISCKTLGLGNGSCGPGVLKKYSIDKSKTHTLHIRVKTL